jgi:serine/threonine protein kinase
MPLASSQDNLLGTTIADRYFIEKELGHGGMSRVYLAYDRKVDNRAVVIKFLARDLLENSYARQKFKQESEALSRIHHPGVVQVLDKDELNGTPYLVMEFVDGETLRSQIPSNGMNLERAASILKQIGAALEQAHQQGVFHRDLKPENILFRRGTDSVVLIDFGIAKVTDSLVAPTTTNGQSAGTLVYMSPEQLRGETVTAASDIYSLAVIAYELVTGRLPFNTSSPARLLELQKKGLRLKPRRLREDLSTKAESIILRALSFDPSARCERASEFGENLAEALLIPGVAPEKRSFKVVLAVLLVVGGVAVISYGVYKLIHTPREPNRSFSYFLTVQTMRDGTDYKSNGKDDTFENGEKFRLTVLTPVPAYVYIFNERPPELNDISFKMIYPNPATNQGSASVGANQSVESPWFTFRGPAGAENFWIVWSTSPVAELDAVTSEAFKDPDGGLTGQTLARVKQYLTAKQREVDATTLHYNANKTAVVRGRRDLLVALAQFNHR